MKPLPGGGFAINRRLFENRESESTLSYTITEPCWSPEEVHAYCEAVVTGPKKPGAMEIVASSWPACGIEPPAPDPIDGEPYGELYRSGPLLSEVERGTLASECEDRLESGDARFWRPFVA